MKHINYNFIVSYLTVLVQSIILYLIFIGAFWTIYIRIPELHRAKWWIAVFVVAVLGHIINIVNLRYNGIFAASFLGSINSLLIYYVLLAGEILPKKYYSLKKLISIMSLSIVTFMILYIIGQHYLNNGFGIVSIMARALQFPAFIALGFAFWRKSKREKNPIPLTSLFFIMPLLWNLGIVIFTHLQKLLNIKESIPFSVTYSFNLIVMVALGMSFVLDILDEAVIRYRKLAEIDPLTGLANRRSFYKLAQKYFNTGKNPLATLIVLDIDHFKTINDTWGHDIGDKALKHVANLISHELRPGDLLTRLGGEEFCIFLPDTDIKNGVKIAERMRSDLENSEFKTPSGLHQLTASFGVSTIHEGDTVESTLNHADKMMYKAKKQGRNRVETEDSSCIKFL